MKSSMQFIAEAKRIHGNLYDYKQFVYVNARTKGTIICRKHGKFEQRPKNHITNRSGCLKCAIHDRGIERRNTKTQFIAEAKRIHGNLYDYKQFVYVNARTKGAIICRKHGKFEQTPNNHLRNRKCPRCAVTKRNEFNTKSHEEFIAEASAVHMNRYSYDNTNYTKSNVPILIECKRHGLFSQKPTKHLYGQGCPNCRESSGEVFIKKILTNIGVKFETQKKFNSCVDKKPLPFDFAAGKILIEFDGIQHFKMMSRWGRWRGLSRVIRHDRIKNKWASQNGYKLCRILYTTQKDQIRKILERLCKNI